jgi:predicted CoA-binding protein
VPVLDAEGALEVLRTARRIAVVGASPYPWRASNVVMAYLLEQGYDCVPVNPEASMVLGQPCFPTLEAAVAALAPGVAGAPGTAVAGAVAGAGVGGSTFDIVDVFRRPEHTPDIARSAVALRCGTLWLQQDIVNWEAARIASDGGLSVVMDRCTAVDHRQLGSRRSDP